MPIKNEKSEVVLFLVSHKDISDLDHVNESGEIKNPIQISAPRVHVSLSLVSLFPDEDTGLEIHKINRPPGFNVERRRSRAVLYQLSGHLQKQDKTKGKLKINNVRYNTDSDIFRLKIGSVHK